MVAMPHMVKKIIKNGKERERERGWKEKEERKKELLSRLTFNSILLLFI